MAFAFEKPNPTLREDLRPGTPSGRTAHNNLARNQARMVDLLIPDTRKGCVSRASSPQK
ncbi:MAG: hypothetical protein ACJA0F_000781 [Dinoroseobacter sp.]|jgi:hypothetical protein